MKRTLIILLLSLILTGCSNTADANLHTEEASQMNPLSSTSTVSTEPTNTTEATQTTQTTLPMEDQLIPAEKNDKTTDEFPQKNEEAATEPTVPSATESVPTEPTPTEKPQPTEPPKETQPVPTEPAPSEPESVPTESAPTQPETPSSKPETTPTEPISTEPVGCTHEWICIHHKEEGHWRAGIVCDCGWTVYGDPSELPSLWNAHSASFPPAESLFDHGGFGSMDEWIVDKPAYDEWVCRHCGEAKE